MEDFWIETTAEAETKVDPETDETLEEIIERAEMLAKRWQFVEAANAYRRAAKLATEKQAKELRVLADQLAIRAKEKGWRVAELAKAEPPVKPTKLALAKLTKRVPVKVKAIKSEIEQRTAAERTAAFMEAASKRAEPNKDEAKIWKSVSVGKETDINEMVELFKGEASREKCSSRVRNALRWLRASGKFKVTQIRGRYKRIV